MSDVPSTRSPAEGIRLGAWLSEATTLMNIKPKTLASYRSLSLLLVSGLGDVPISSLTTQDVQRFVAQTSQTLSASRTRQAYSVLSQSLGMAATYGLLQQSPCVNVRLPRLPKTEMSFLTVAEVETLANACEPYGAFVRCLAYTGLRWGEATALRHSDVDGNRITVRRAAVDIGGVVTFGTPKSHAQRVVYVPDSLALPQGDPDSLVFQSYRRGKQYGRVIRGSNFRQRCWFPAIAAMGKPHLRIHDLRHTACALLIQANVHPKTIQRLMGHSSITVTMDTYGHLIGNALEEASMALDKVLTA